MGTLIPPLPPPPSPSRSHSRDGGQMTQPLWTNVSTELTKNELFGFNFSKGANKNMRVWMPVILRQGGRGREAGVDKKWNIPKLWYTSHYHLYGKPGNSRENSNGTVHPGGNYPEKK